MAGRQLLGGTRLRETLTAFSALLLSAQLALSLTAFGTPNVVTEDDDPVNSRPSTLEPDQQPHEHTRSLPLHSAASGLDQVVVDDVVSLDAMQLKLMELAWPLEFDAWIWHTLTQMESIALPREGRWGDGTIPYSHPDLEWSLEYQLALIPTLERDQMLDLSDALIVADAAFTEVNLGLVLAQVLLQRYALEDQSCEIQLQLLYAYSLGGRPDLGDVGEVARSTATACPDDPTPHWLMAQLASRLAVGRVGTPPQEA